MKAGFGMIGLLMGLTGCAHLLPARPAWHCIEHARDGVIEAATGRMLDARGHLITMRSHWVRPFALQPRIFIQAEWLRTTAAPTAVEGRVTFRLTARQPLERYRLELRRETATAPPLDGRLIGATEKADQDPQLIAPWSLVARYAWRGRPLFLAAIDRHDQVRDVEPIDSGLFRRGLALVARTDRGSAAKAADFAGRCEKHQEIILV